MKQPAGSLLFWAPRLLALLFALFISLFALDVFDEGLGLGGTILALSIHLLPTIAVLAVLVLAWRWEWVGAVAYFSLGILYLVVAWGRFHWSAYATITGPLFLIGLMFFIGWFYRAKSTPLGKPRQT